MTPAAQIRELEKERDLDALVECFVELQNVERRLDPRIPEGSTIADRYLKLMFERCRKYSGKVFVAEVEGRVAGFVCVWARAFSTEPDDDPAEYAFVSDLVVLPVHRGRGVGRDLLRTGEEYARSLGAHCLRLSVKAGNAPAMALYAAEGFEELEVFLEKMLD